MKTLLVMVILVFGLQLGAQVESKMIRKQPERSQQLKDYSAEEIATLNTKRMTLDLNLNNAQQNEIYNMTLEALQQRRNNGEQQKKVNGEGQALTKEQRFARMNNRLDRQIEQKNKMRRILDHDQFKRWERQNIRGKRKGQARKKHLRRRH